MFQAKCNDRFTVDAVQMKIKHLKTAVKWSILSFLESIAFQEYHIHMDVEKL